MCEHEKKNCPRCNTAFECKVGSILLCQCTTVALNEEERDFIASKFTDCLCAACLRQMKSGFHEQKLKYKLYNISPLHFPKK